MKNSHPHTLSRRSFLATTSAALSLGLGRPGHSAAAWPASWRESLAFLRSGALGARHWTQLSVPSCPGGLKEQWRHSVARQLMPVLPEVLPQRISVLSATGPGACAAQFLCEMTFPGSHTLLFHASSAFISEEVVVRGTLGTLALRDGHVTQSHPPLPSFATEPVGDTYLQNAWERAQTIADRVNTVLAGLRMLSDE